MYIPVVRKLAVNEIQFSLWNQQTSFGKKLSCLFMQEYEQGIIV